MLRWISQFWRDDNGQDMVEYALMVALMTVAGGAVVPPIANSAVNVFSKAISVLERFGAK
jgi:Flp pilus assembly pilin Flp